MTEDKKVPRWRVGDEIRKHIRTKTKERKNAI